MKTGIELIAQERKEQIEKHGRTIAEDVMYNGQCQLAIGATALITNDTVGDFRAMPKKWDDKICMKMCLKSYKERLVIAGALIAAEIDRLQFEEK